jgi:hypothetical protein
MTEVVQNRQVWNEREGGVAVLLTARLSGHQVMINSNAVLALSFMGIAHSSDGVQVQSYIEASTND